MQPYCQNFPAISAHCLLETPTFFTRVNANLTMNYNTFSEAVSVLFIDRAVHDYHQIVQTLKSRTHVHFLESNEDGVHQITRILGTDYLEKTVKEIHLVSQGAPGCLYLGDAELSLARLTKYAKDLKRWFSLPSMHLPFYPPPTLANTLSTPSIPSSLPPTLFLYNRNVTIGDAGAELLAKLGNLTGATVESAPIAAIATLFSSPQGRAHAVADELIVVDTSVAGYEAILHDLNAPNKQREVILLDGSEDGVEELAVVLTDYENIKALHLLCHGDTGSLFLGTATLNRTSMRRKYAAALTAISQALAHDADLLLYGCKFAQGVRGFVATQTLALVTGANIAASETLTGASKLGGDWTLDLQVGPVKTQPITAPSFHNILTTLSASTPPTFTPPASMNLTRPTTLTITTTAMNTTTQSRPANPATLRTDARFCVSSPAATIQNSKFKIQNANLSPLPSSPSTPPSLLFIDPSVDAYQHLLAGLQPGIQAHVLDANQDGIHQITQIIQATIARAPRTDARFCVSKQQLTPPRTDARFCVSKQQLTSPRTDARFCVSKQQLTSPRTDARFCVSSCVSFCVSSDRTPNPHRLPRHPRQHSSRQYPPQPRYA